MSGRSRDVRAASALIVLVFLLAALQLVVVESGARARHGADFGKLYYGLVQDDLYAPTPATETVLFEGRTFTFSNLNPPHVALLVLPLSWLPFEAAWALWLAVQLLCAIVVCRLSAPRG